MKNRKYRLTGEAIRAEDLNDLIAWLGQRPWLTQGQLVQEFEEAWRRRVGVAHALMVNSGSSANLLMFSALRLSGRMRNNRVVVPAIAWSTTVAPAVQLGLEVIPCDVDAETFGLDPVMLEAICRDRDPAAVVVVHTLGVPARVEEILRLQERFGFALLEDACAAAGSRLGDRAVGSYGDVGTFSYFYSHQISTIEGGMVCTSDDDLWKLLLQLRSHGWGRDLPEEDERAALRRWGVDDVARAFTFYVPGFNVRSTEINARIGLSQLARMDDLVERRARNYDLYVKRLFGKNDLLAQRGAPALVSSMGYGFAARSPGHRREIAAALDAEGIDFRPLSGGNVFRQPFLRTVVQNLPPLPVADRIHACGLQVPNHPELDEVATEFIADVVLSVG